MTASFTTALAVIEFVFPLPFPVTITAQVPSKSVGGPTRLPCKGGRHTLSSVKRSRQSFLSNLFKDIGSRRNASLSGLVVVGSA